MAARTQQPPLSILVSGCHSGPNPSAGTGIARSIRLAYPTCHLTGKDHSIHASGLHDPVFDDVWVCVPWDELDLAHHREQIRTRLHPDGWLLSTQDLEIRWLTEAPIDRALVPPLDALLLTGKPEIGAARSLPVRVPDWVPLTASDRDINAFCRAHDWRVWIKGSAYEAKSVRTWTELSRQRHDLGQTWGGDQALFVQADVKGWEVSIAFAALEGRLLDALFMEKRLVTEIGKTWAGAVSDVPPALRAPLAELLAELRWTGGGELEFVRDRQDELWLIDWNPRFPAWVFGGTLAGRNLPAALVGAATGVSPFTSPRVASQFTRVVTELPVRDGLALPPPPLEKPDPARGGKNPSGMPLLMRRLAERANDPPPAQPGWLPPALAQDIRDACDQVRVTPERVLFRRLAEEHFATAAALVDTGSVGRVPFEIAYSVKTNPDPAFLHLARTTGLLAEVISTAEMRAALAAGFKPGQIVYNGPVPLDRQVAYPGDIAAAFADSPVALRKYVECPLAEIVGLRVRPPLVESRFGVQLEEPAEFAEIVETVRAMPASLPLGISVHVQSSEVGPQRWESLARSALYFGAALADLTGKQIALLDLGGGWAADDLDLALAERLPRLVTYAQQIFPGLKRAIIEPGKSLVEPCGGVICRVVEVRKRGDGSREVVVDGSIAEVPLSHAFPHRLVAASSERLELLERGKDRVLGRLCMENDILAPSVTLPDWLSEGDTLCVCDSGAYDASMAYRFGMGSELLEPPNGVPLAYDGAISSRSRSAGED